MQVPDPLRRHIVARQDDRTTRSPTQPSDRLDELILAVAGNPRDPEDLTCPHFEAQVMHHLVAPIIVYSTVLIPTNILFEAALSFLGVGVQPPTPSWGAMIADATNIFDIAWWFMLFPGLALLFTVLAFNLLGDGLQDALNPRSKR